MGQRIDLTGKRFGKLTVIEYSHTERNGNEIRAYWKCKCDCGNETTVKGKELKSGNTKSCGCLKIERGNHTHNLSKTRLYTIFCHMKDRCYNKNSRLYKWYGGRGITVCNEWLNDFQTFYDWAMSNGYKENLTIERKDVNGNYCHENCCWITKSEQQSNKRSNLFYSYDGETKTLKQWSKEFGINYQTLYHRVVKKKMDIKEALETEVASEYYHRKN